MSALIEGEIEKLWAAANTDRSRNQLYCAAQQALSWALDPANFRSPLDFVRDIPLGSPDCSRLRHPAPLPERIASTSGVV